MGADFVEWAWDPVGGATGYEGQAFLERARDDITRFQTREPTYRWEGLPPDELATILLRSVRETAGGTAYSPWVGRFPGATLPAIPPEPMACTDERERALAFRNGIVAVREWDGTPFRVDMVSNFPDYVSDADLLRLLQPVELLDSKIEEQLGYRILEAGNVIRAPEGMPPDWDSELYRYPDVCLPREHGQLQGYYMDDEDVGVAQARPECGEFYYLRPMLENWPCLDCPEAPWAEGVYLDATTLHEILHLFGFDHFDHDERLARGIGVPMSRILTLAAAPDADAVRWSDIDLLRCVFPEGG